MKNNLWAMMGFRLALPLWDAEAEGGSGGGEAGSAPPAAGEAEGQASALTPPAPDGTAPQDGQQPEGGQEAGAKEEGSKDEGEGGEAASPENFAVDVPEGMEQFSGEFEAYTTDAKQWLTDNPGASAADALKWAASRQAEAVQQQMKDGAEAWQKQVKDWGDQARADQELGGARYDENVATAVKAVQAFGSPELNDLLNETGLGSHPEMIRFAHKVGKHLSEAPVMTTQGGGAKKSFIDALNRTK